MTNSNNMRSLFTPSMASRVIMRTGGHALGKFAENRSRRLDYDWSARIDAGQTLIELAKSVAQVNSTFIAVEHLEDSHYARKTEEMSKCPVLMAKHGYVGRFILAKLAELSDEKVSLSGVIYEDRTKSHQDSLIRTKFHVQTGELVCQTRFPDVLSARDISLATDGLRQSGPLSAVHSLTKLLSESTISHEPSHIAASVNRYTSRLAQYNGGTQAEIIPLVPSQREDSDQLIFTSATLT